MQILRTQIWESFANVWGRGIYRLQAGGGQWWCLCGPQTAHITCQPKALLSQTGAVSHFLSPHITHRARRGAAVPGGLKEDTAAQGQYTPHHQSCMPSTCPESLEKDQCLQYPKLYFLLVHSSHK